MSLLNVARVEHYGDRAAIRAFAASVLDGDAELRALLASGDPARLIVLKPNWIQESHEYRPDVWEPVITHPAVLLAVLEVLAERIGGPATLVHLRRAAHLRGLRRDRPARRTASNELDRLRRRCQRCDRAPRPAPRALDARGGRRRRAACATPRIRAATCASIWRATACSTATAARAATTVRTTTRECVNEHHRGDVHEYLLAGTPMACDLFINLPKLKTHKKTGITCCLKNLVGINGDKNWLPHHTEGTPAQRRRRVPRGRPGRSGSSGALKHGRARVMLRRARLGNLALPQGAQRRQCRCWATAKPVMRNGNWQGNDTCWRMALDLNRALLYGRPDGTLARCEPVAKRYLAIVDGIIGGEGNGPLCPDPVGFGRADRRPRSGSGRCARLPLDGIRAASRLPIVARAFDPHRWPIARASLDRCACSTSGPAARSPCATSRPR